MMAFGAGCHAPSDIGESSTNGNSCQTDIKLGWHPWPANARTPCSA